MAFGIFKAVSHFMNYSICVVSRLDLNLSFVFFNFKFKSFDVYQSDMATKGARRVISLLIFLKTSFRMIDGHSGFGCPKIPPSSPSPLKPIPSNHATSPRSQVHLNQGIRNFSSPISHKYPLPLNMLYLMHVHRNRF